MLWLDAKAPRRLQFKIAIILKYISFVHHK